MEETTMDSPTFEEQNTQLRAARGIAPIRTANVAVNGNGVPNPPSLLDLINEKKQRDRGSKKKEREAAQASLLTKMMAAIPEIK